LAAGSQHPQAHFRSFLAFISYALGNFDFKVRGSCSRRRMGSTRLEAKGLADATARTAAGFYCESGGGLSDIKFRDTFV